MHLTYFKTQSEENSQQENMSFTFKFRQAKVAQLFTTQDAKQEDMSLSCQCCYRISEVFTSLISRWCL